MSVLHHAGQRRRPVPHPRRGAVLGFVVGFLLALPGTAFVSLVALPSLIPMRDVVIAEETSAAMALGMAAVAGLATGICAAARSVRNR